MLNILSCLKRHHLVLAVLMLALVVRVIALVHSSVINDDGPLYIHQARALLNGDWHSASACGFPYLSIYPFLIIPFFSLTGDWILSAQAICLVFGFLTLVPIYLINRYFFDEKVSAAATFVFAVNPVLVELSVDVTKDMVGWFFALWGMYFFIQSQKKPYYPSLSSIFFVLAMLARIEIALFILASYLYLFVFQKEQKLRLIFYFSLPLVLLASFAVFGFFIFKGADVNLFSGYLYPKIRIYLDAFRNYEFINSGLKRLINSEALMSYDYKFIPLFLRQVRESLWLIPVLVILKKTMQAFFMPFFLLTLIGMGNLKDNIRNKPHYAYFSLLSLLSFLMLYSFYLLVWAISKRYTMIFLFTALPFTGYGIVRIYSWFAKSAVRKTFGILLVVLLCGITLFKGVAPTRQDKLVLKEIGQYIAALEGQNEEISVAVSQGIVLFYANLKNKNASCPRPIVSYSDFITMDGQQIKDKMKEHGITYFLWEEEAWKKAPPFRKTDGWEPVKTWESKEMGRYRLYRLHI